ncbi:MAG TPA: uracil-DNA glycosylase [Rhizobacter sp.]|nr:uracil-DNA glycosylase [Rhizobacter sp.]
MTADDLAATFETLPAAWAKVLSAWTPALCDNVVACVQQVSGHRPIAPEDPFRALRFAAPNVVKVVVFGQDPYPTAGHADGLAFSAGRGKPRSLARIFEVLAQDRPDFVPPTHWRLDPWARQGVLLLNPTLTVEVGRAGSHVDCGWRVLTSEIVKILCEQKEPPVFLLWGSQAQNFFTAARPAGAAPRVLTARHPSYDFKKEFMRDGSHFMATRDLIDWWDLGH